MRRKMAHTHSIWCIVNETGPAGLLDAATMTDWANLWGVRWLAGTPGKWYFHSLEVSQVQNGWQVRDQHRKSKRMPTPEQALESFLGEPVLVMGVWYFPHDPPDERRSRLYLARNQPLSALRRTGDTWSTGDFQQGHGSPEEAILSRLELELNFASSNFSAALDKLKVARAKLRAFNL